MFLPCIFDVQVLEEGLDSFVIVIIPLIVEIELRIHKIPSLVTSNKGFFVEKAKGSALLDIATCIQANDAGKLLS
jgi:hypothetical protein